MIAIMIGEGKVAQTDFARMIGPGLQQPRRVGLKPVTLWVKMIVGEESQGGWDAGYEVRDARFLASRKIENRKSRIENRHGAAIDFRWVCSSG
jgi:hypothetical protein